jgi:hypothetical protein
LKDQVGAPPPRPAAQKEKPRRSAGPSSLTYAVRLAVLIRHLLPLTVGLLTARILLLLTRLLAAALLLLAGLLTRVLVLLARVVLIGHWGISVVDRSQSKRKRHGIRCRGTTVSLRSLRGKGVAAL